MRTLLAAVTVLGLLAGHALGQGAQADQIKRRAKELNSQNNVRQGVPPPAQPQTTAPPTAPTLATNTQGQPLVTTNWVTAHPSFRRVGGRLYNIEKSYLWQEINGTCEKVLKDGIVVRTIVKKSRSYVQPASGPAGYGNFIGGSGGGGVRTETWEESGPRIFLKNYYDATPTTESKIYVKAMKTGVLDYKGDVLEKWDCGTPNIVPVVVTNAPASQPKPK